MLKVTGKFLIPTTTTLMLLVLALFTTSTQAQSGHIAWGPQINISRSPDKTSVDPFLLADPAGVAHLFWAEKVFDTPGNAPETILYSRWDGNHWSTPVDIHFAPPEHGNQIISHPHAVIDDKVVIHLIWLTLPDSPNYAVYYSQAHATQAVSSPNWSQPIALASDLTGSEYSIDIKIDSLQNLHVIFSRVPAGDSPPELRATSYIRSADRGLTWSDPVDIYTVSVPTNGTSCTRLLVDEYDNVYASWTVWDMSGNGQAVYFARSLDNGHTWDAPIQLAERFGDEYERDWNNMAYLGNNTIVAFWEGGWRAYRHAMYSYDNGVTWTEPKDLFPGLIGENGFAEFVHDGSGNVHVFLAQRTREGNNIQTNAEGLWHSFWDGDTRWYEPSLSGGINPMLNPKIAIVNGNRAVVAWYTSPEFEIRVMAGQIIGVPETLPQPWAPISPEASNNPEVGATPDDPTPISESGPIQPSDIQSESITAPSSPGGVIVLSLLPTVFLIGAGIYFVRRRN